MHQELQNTNTYTKNLTLLCISLVAFGFGCIFLGYLLLPFAAATYACLLHYEKKTRRIFSYAIPAAIYTFNVLINGFFSLEGVIYVAIGAIFYLLNLKGKPKRETVFYSVLVISIFIFLSFFAIGFTANDTLSFSALKAYYAGIYDTLKRSIIDHMSSISMQDELGNLFFLYTRENAEKVFHSILLILPSLLIILAFLLTGITYKIYDFLRVRIFGIERRDLELFVPSKFLAYTYIVVALLALFSSSSSDILAISISNINNVLLAIFAYFGFKIAFAIVKVARGTFFALAAFIVAISLLTTTAITLLSFIGVFFALGAQQTAKEN